MKSLIITLVALFGLQMSVMAQTNLEDVFKKAEGAIENKSSKNLVEVLTSASSLFKNELTNIDPEIRTKFLGQTDDLMLLVPSALSGKVDFVGISGLFKRLKLLYAANKLKNVLAGGRGDLINNTERIASSLRLMESSAAGLKLDDVKGFESLVAKAVKSTSKLEKGGIFKNCRAKTAEKQLNTLVKTIVSNV